MKIPKALPSPNPMFSRPLPSLPCLSLFSLSSGGEGLGLAPSPLPFQGEGRGCRPPRLSPHQTPCFPGLSPLSLRRGEGVDKGRDLGTLAAHHGIQNTPALPSPTGLVHGVSGRRQGRLRSDRFLGPVRERKGGNDHASGRSNGLQRHEARDLFAVHRCPCEQLSRHQSASRDSGRLASQSREEVAPRHLAKEVPDV